MRRLLPIAAAVLLPLPWLALEAPAHTIYVAADNHTDYGWNDTVANYEAAMLSDLDYFLAQVDQTSGSSADEQGRFTADGWWWFYLYQHNRTPDAFADLLAKMRSGHITVPLNPFVTLYGAMSTEMAIRAGYYAGRMARAYDLAFPLAYASMENTTAPWGLSSLLAGSGVRYAWKGICYCVSSSPQANVPAELFRWQGPDGGEVLMKWYRLLGANTDRGGYAEARDAVSGGSPAAALAQEIQTTESTQPGIPVTGLFGVGWDDTSWQKPDVVNAVVAFNASTGASGDHAVVSNEVDFFQALEASGASASLPVLRGGFGNDWDMWPISLAERAARQRRAIEQLRLAEALAAIGAWAQPSSWTPLQQELETGLTGTWKFFEHTWSRNGDGPTIAELAAEKEGWTEQIETAVADVTAAAESSFEALVATPANEDRVAVLNPLAFARTDVVDLAVPDPGPWVVADVATSAIVPSQVVVVDGVMRLRWLASDVPSLGYRTYRYAHGTPPSSSDAAAVTVGTQTIESTRYRVVLGQRGEITSLVDKSQQPARELAGTGALNNWGSGTLDQVIAENVGPVSATLRIDSISPQRTVRVTLLAGVDRIEIDDLVRQNVVGFNAYGFDVNLASPQLSFEEVGAIARPGLIAQGGDYLPGARASRLTLNHFLDFATTDYTLVLSNWDAYALQVGASTDSSFDLSGSQVFVLATDSPLGAGILDQGGDTQFRNRFALRGLAGTAPASEAMRTSLGHQNPLHAVALQRSQAGPLSQPVASLLGIDAPNVVVTAFKPAEESDRGLVVRAWELDGTATDFSIDASPLHALQAWSTSLVESDVAPVPVTNGRIQASLAPREIGTWRFLGAAPEPAPLELALGALFALCGLSRVRKRE
jgi:alpha-mannosidase